MFVKQQKQIYPTQSEGFKMNYEKMTTRELLEESLKQLKIIQLDNLRREPNHPRNKFNYAPYDNLPTLHHKDFRVGFRFVKLTF